MSRVIEFEMKVLKSKELILLQQMGNVVNDMALRLGIIDAKEWQKRNEKNKTTII